MNHKRMKLAIAGLALAVAVGYLAFAGMRQGWVYHVQVDQLWSNPEYQNEVVRVCGKVCEQNLQSEPGKLMARFELQGTGRNLPVMYEGAIPDLFKPGCEVVVEGRMDRNGVFVSSTKRGDEPMMTKCASKYQSAEHAKQAKEST